MKKIKYLLLTCSFCFLHTIFGLPAYAADGSINVTPSSVVVAPGKTTTVTVAADNAAGRIDLSTSNANVATATFANSNYGQTQAWLDKSSVSITIKGVATGSAKINVALTDVSDYSSNALTGTKQISVTVKEGSTPDDDPTPTPSGDDDPTPTPSGDDDPTPTPSGNNDPDPIVPNTDNSTPTPTDDNDPDPIVPNTSGSMSSPNTGGSPTLQGGGNIINSFANWCQSGGFVIIVASITLIIAEVCVIYWLRSRNTRFSNRSHHFAFSQNRAYTTSRISVIATIILALITTSISFISYNTSQVVGVENTSLGKVTIECTPTQDWLDYMALSEDERKGYFEPVHCREQLYEGQQDESTTEQNSDSGLGMNPVVGATPSSSKYDARDDGLVTPVKNQYSTGMCWDFAAIAAVESCALKNKLGTFDLSETHLLYSLSGDMYSDTAGKKDKFSDLDEMSGGQHLVASNYFFNGFGQRTESQDSFLSHYNQTTGRLSTITSSQYDKGSQLLNVKEMTEVTSSEAQVCSANQITDIKTAIIGNGALMASMYWPDGEGSSYIRTSKSSTAAAVNHGVTIVGWDDSISASHFSGATRNGAWIIKNSWGTEVGENGYFYVSYDDHFICTRVVSFSGVSKDTFDHTYNSGPLFDTTAVIGLEGSSAQYIASKFSKASSKDESLDRVSFQTLPDMKYTVYLAPDASTNNSSSWKQLGTHTSSNTGVKSIDVNNTKVTNNFAIVLKIESTSSSIPPIIAVTCKEDQLSELKNLTFSSGKNLLSFDGGNWEDLSSLIINNRTSTCVPDHIHAYTNEPTASSDDIVIKDSSKASIKNSNLIVKVNKGSTFNRSTLLNYATLNNTYSIKDASEKQVTTDSAALGTGSTITFVESQKSYTIIVLGDADADGKVADSDAYAIREHIMEKTKITNSARKTAALISGGTTISARDYVNIRKNYGNVS